MEIEGGIDQKGGNGRLRPDDSMLSVEAHPYSMP
jgi:hypothetical protein